jgi:hypothetical protein
MTFRRLSSLKSDMGSPDPVPVNQGNAELAPSAYCKSGQQKRRIIIKNTSRLDLPVSYGAKTGHSNK